MDIVSRGNSVSELPSLPRDSCKTPITMTQEGPDGSAQGSFPGGWIKATALPEQALLQKVTSAPDTILDGQSGHWDDLRLFSTPDPRSWTMHFAKMAARFRNPFQQQIVSGESASS